jgi:hypothetical protein
VDNIPANDGWTLAFVNISGGNIDATLPFNFTAFGVSNGAASISVDGYLFFSSGGPIYLDSFVADIDARGTNGGYVWHKSIGNKFAVAWDHVRGYQQPVDKFNTFQILISDGTDESMGLGNNVCYCYNDMQWTDSFSQGLGQVGVAVGDDYRFRLGQFTQAGAAYDGGSGNIDGFDFLDRKSICFKISGTNNVPPIAVNVPEKNRVTVDCGQSIVNLKIIFVAPEETGQIVALMPSGAASGLTVAISNLMTNLATATINWAPTAAATVNLVLAASDGHDTTTVNVNFTASGPSCQAPAGTTYHVWDPVSDKEVSRLTNNSVVCINSTSYNIEARFPKAYNASKAKLALANTCDSTKNSGWQNEAYPPFFVYGDTPGTGDVYKNPNSKRLINCNWELRAKADNRIVEKLFFKQQCP